MRRPSPEPAGPGQESVWGYLRPPRLEPFAGRIEVELDGAVVADTRRALRLLETSHPPTYYVPVADVAPGALEPAPGGSWCEWKGRASYFDVVAGDRRAARSAWGYPEPTDAYRELVDHVAFYVARMDACRVDGQVARPQPGGFYGGWVTEQVVGPFKGEPGTEWW